MPRIQLHGSGTPRTIDVPEPSGRGRVEIPADNEKYRKGTFAALRDLINPFRLAGLSESDFWDMIKHQLGITSRKEIEIETWALLSHQLNVARHNPDTLSRLIAKIHQFRAEMLPEEEVPVEDATPIAFAEPDQPLSTCFVIRIVSETGKKKFVFQGEYSEEVEKRCQEHAEKTKCIVHLFHNGQDPIPFKPKESK